ncbi:cation-dependent mannose-6-phosphate receptor-like [Ostrea edulis]|uniref:cation-dependent mannose-6-phosphate receptor-like n=1 Tax=Ostrea edulis TaxID=37623 RepID=UPI0024AFF664|nr:cation-dependent mannose-6-phosphate receptor-like [Ostrea edulis]
MVLVGNLVKKLSPCSCKMDSGFVVDLSSVSNNDNTPYFKDVLKPGSNNEMYSFNPCSGFTEGTGSCSDVALCKISVTGPLEQYISLGSQSTATFSVNGDVIDLHYTDGSSGSTSVVHISCDDGTLGSMEPKGTTGGPNEINLSTKLACETNTKLSGGTIILIGFVSIIFLYIVVGVVVQRLVRKQRGVQAIPNYVFWSSVTGNIKSGIVYTVKCGKTGQRFDKI